jgi:hypothetical protein
MVRRAFLQGRKARNDPKGVLRATMSSRLLVNTVAALAAVSLLVAAPAVAESPGINTPATITGTAAVGEQLTAHNGTWLYLDGSSCKAECTMTYQWQRCSGGCADIQGATGRFYTVQAADAGHRLRVMETMTSEDCGEWNYSTGTRECRSVSKSAPSGQTAVVGGSGGAAPSAPAAPTIPAGPVVPAAPLAPAATATPQISGLAMVDETLSATHASWTGTSPLATVLRWERCEADGSGCVDLGLNGTTYTVLAVDVGKRLRVVSAASNAAGHAAVASTPTDVVVELRPHAGRTSLHADKVVAPHRLVLERAVAVPKRVRRGATIWVRVRVLDSRGFTIQGAVVSAVALPQVAVTAGAPVVTDANGEATLILTTSPKLKPSRTKSISIVVTARRPSDRAISPRSAVTRLVVKTR